MKLLHWMIAACLSFAIAPVSADEIDFRVTNEHALSVAIRTDRLLIRTLESKDRDTFITLYGDPVAFAKFNDGVPRAPDVAAARFQTLYGRMQDMNPFTALAITLADDPESFLGIIALQAGDEPGQGEISFILFERYWNRGYGREAAYAILYTYAPMLALKGYGPEGHPLRQIVATARTDNTASIKILERLGLKITGSSEKYGALRYHFVIDLADLFSTPPM